MEESEADMVNQIDALLASKAADDEQLGAIDGVDLGSHLDVFHSILKQVNMYVCRSIDCRITGWSKKVNPKCSTHNFVKCLPILKILSLL